MIEKRGSCSSMVNSCNETEFLEVKSARYFVNPVQETKSAETVDKEDAREVKIEDSSERDTLKVQLQETELKVEELTQKQIEKDEMISSLEAKIKALTESAKKEKEETDNEECDAAIDNKPRHVRSNNQSEWLLTNSPELKPQNELLEDGKKLIKLKSQANLLSLTPAGAANAQHGQVSTSDAVSFHLNLSASAESSVKPNVNAANAVAAGPPQSTFGQDL